MKVIRNQTCRSFCYNSAELHNRTRNATIGAMNDFATLSRMLENLIRFGVIAAVQMAPPARAGKKR